MAGWVSGFRKVSFFEGLTYLALLGVAMPLKYAAGRPEAVEWVGLAHGIAFLAFCAGLLAVHVRCRLPLIESFTLFGLSLVPFGFIVIDRRLARLN